MKYNYIRLIHVIFHCLMHHLTLKPICFLSKQISSQRLTGSLLVFVFTQITPLWFSMYKTCPKHSGASLFLAQIAEGVRWEYVCSLGNSSPCRPDCVSIQSQETAWPLRPALLWGNTLHAGLTSRVSIHNIGHVSICGAHQNTHRHDYYDYLLLLWLFIIVDDYVVVLLYTCSSSNKNFFNISVNKTCQSQIQIQSHYCHINKYIKYKFFAYKYSLQLWQRFLWCQMMCFLFLGVCLLRK